MAEQPIGDLYELLQQAEPSTTGAQQRLGVRRWLTVGLVRRGPLACCMLMIHARCKVMQLSLQQLQLVNDETMKPGMYFFKADKRYSTFLISRMQHISSFFFFPAKRQSKAIK